MPVVVLLSVDPLDLISGLKTEQKSKKLKSDNYVCPISEIGHLLDLRSDKECPISDWAGIYA